MWVILNNEILEEHQARISVFDHGFLYGDGVFETLRAYDGHLFLLEHHLKRLRRSCELIGLTMPTPQTSWQYLLETLLHRNHLANAMIRISISRGEGKIGLDPALCENPTLVILSQPLPHHPPSLWDQGVELVLLKTQRNAPSALPPEIKALSFLNNVLGKREASLAGAFDGIMMNTDGHLTECTTSNVFFVRESVLHTPSKDCGILHGVTRETVIALARNLGFPVQEGPYKPESLQHVEECFLTNTGFEILPVRHIRDSFAANTVPGPMTQTLRLAFQEFVREQQKSS